MAEPKSDPQDDQKKRRSPIETEIDAELDLDADEEFHGLDESVAEAEEEWEKRAGRVKSGASEEQQLAELFAMALPAASEADTKPLAIPGEPMRGPMAETPPAQWRVNVRDVLGPTGDNPGDKPHQEHFKEFGVHMNGREVNLPGTENPTLRLGRNPLKTDLSFTDGFVSREHANITKEGGKVFITNLQDSNKTTIIRDGKEITVAQSPAKTELLPGDTIRLGRFSEMQWLRSTDMQNLGKPALYNPKPGEADPAASESARKESNQYLRNHEYGKPFPDGFQNVGGINEIDEKGWHHDKERPSVVIDQRPGADPALEQFVKDMKAKYSHLTGDPKALAEAMAREAKAALEPKGWSSAAIDDGYAKLRSENAGKRMLLGDFLNAAKYSKGAGVCNHQAMLTKVAFDSFYPADMPNRPEMKMVRGFYGESPAGLPVDLAMNHAWNTLTVPNKDGSKGQELIVDPRHQIHGEALAAHPNHHAGKDVPQMRPRDMIPKMFDFREAPLNSSEVERLKGQEVLYGGKGWKIKNIDGQFAEISSYALKNADASHLAEANPEAAKSGKWVIGQEYNIRRSSGELESGWTLNNVVEVEGKKVFVMGKADALVRRVMFEDLQKQNGEVFEKVVQERAAKQKAAEIPAPNKVNPESHGFVAGREVYHNGNHWVVQGQDGKNIEIARAATKTTSQAQFEELNGTAKPKVGKDYLVRRSSGEVETWKLTGIDNNTGELTLRSQTAFREKVSLERLAEQNRSVVGPLDISKVLNDPASKVRLIARWTDGNSSHDKWIGEVEGPKGERVSVMVHKPPHGNQRDWVRLRNDLAAQELAKAMGAPELFPPTALRDGMMVQAFIGQQGENVANYLHTRSRQDAELRAAEPDLEKRVQKMLEKDPVLRQRVAEGIAFSVLLGDHDQHGLNFVINRDGAGPNDFHIARIDTDYAFSRDKAPNMDQAGNYGSIINGAFAHLSEKDLPADVRAKIKTVSDQLSTPAGREAFQRTTNLSKESVEALAERARIMSETGKFPRSKTMDEQRREFGMGSVRAEAAKVGDVVSAEKIGTVKAPTDNIKATVEKTAKLMAELQTELAKGGTLEGESLESARAKVKELLRLDPTLIDVLKPFSDQLNPAKYPNRPQEIMSRLNSSDKSTRCEGLRQEISRLLGQPTQSAADQNELVRLKRALFQEMKEDKAASKEVKQLHDRVARQEKLNDKDTARYAELTKSEAIIEERLKSNIDFTVKMLKAEAKAGMLSGSTRGGDATQGLIMKMFDKNLQQPRSELGGKSYAQLGYEVVPLKASVAMDDAGADFILVNKNTGDFMFVDPTQKPLTDRSKARLPEIRKQGIISSDPYSEEYTDGDRRNVGTPEYVRRREADINNQIDEILHRAREGTALNLGEIPIPPSTREAEATTKEGKQERLERIGKMPDIDKAIEIKQWRNELLARQQGLNEMIPLAREKSQQLREQAKLEPDMRKRAQMESQATLLKDWFEHTQGTSSVHREGSPLIFIERTLKDLDFAERSLPDKYKPLSRPQATPGQAVQAPADMAQKLNEATVKLQEQEAIVAGRKPASHQEIAVAADRLASMYEMGDVEVETLLDLKNRSEFRNTLDSTGVELTNEFIARGSLDKPTSGQDAAVELTLDHIINKQAQNQTWTNKELKDFKALVKAYKRGDADAVEEVHKRISAGIDTVTGGTARAAAKPIAEQTKEQQKATYEEISKARDYAKLKDFALNTTDPELAKEAVRTILVDRPEKTIEMLREIASSNSHAVGPAIDALFMESDSEKDNAAFKTLLQDRWNNGELIELLKSGKLTAQDLVNGLDKGGYSFAEKSVGELFDKLGDHPKLKEAVSIAIVKEDSLMSKSFENRSIPDSLRLKAIEYLGTQTSQESTRALDSVLRISETQMSQAAKKALMERWTTQKQNPTGESVSELMLGDRLKRYVSELGSVNWPDKRDLTELRERQRNAQDEVLKAKWNLAFEITDDIDAHDELVEKYADKQYMENLLKDKPAQLAQYRDYLKMEAEAKTLSAEYTDVLKSRMKVVESFVKDYCKELGINAPAIEFFEPGNKAENRGEYYAGKGKILINDSLLASGLAPTDAFLGTLFHEIGHLEQDSLGVRRLADELKIGKQATADEMQKLRELYKDKYKQRELPEEKFIREALAERNGVTLTEGQAVRADKLIDAFAQRQLEADRQEALEKHGEKLSETAKYLKEAVPLSLVLRGDEPVKKAQELLQVEKLPKNLETAISDWHAAVASNAPNANQLEATASDLLMQECRRAGSKAKAEANTLYRQRSHEVETWDIGNRARFFGRETVAQKMSIPATPDANAGGYVRPRRGPGPVADAVTTTTYESNSDGTQVRRSELAGKPLVGDEKTWKDLLTKEELAQIREKRESLEKLEKENKLNEDTRRELASIRELEANLHDPAAHKRIIEKMGERRPSGGFRGGEVVGRLSGIAILTSAVLSWCASKSHAEDTSTPKHAPLGKR